MAIRNLGLALTLPLPWPVRRLALQALFGFSIHPTSRIGLAWIAPKHLVLEERSRIGHFTVCKGLDLLHLKSNATIGRLNWITGYPSSSKEFFRQESGRAPELVIGAHAAVTNRHLIDCTAAVTIGDFSTIAGFRSQILTHSIDLDTCRQTARPIEIGRYCFVGTDCVLLGGSGLPDYSVLGAKSLLIRRYAKTHHLYAGSPAHPIKPLGEQAPYFLRRVGMVQ